MPADAETVAFYDREAAAYAARTLAPEDRPFLAEFIRRLSPGAAVLDLGSGGGWAAARMAAEGLEVLAQDVSAGLLAEAGRRAGVRTRLGAFADLADRAAFDGVWASFSLLHAPRADMPDHLARIRAALKPGGLLYVGLEEREGEARDRLGRFYCYWRADALRAALLAAGFEAVETTRSEGGVGYDGAPATGLHAFARRPPAP